MVKIQVKCVAKKARKKQKISSGGAQLVEGKYEQSAGFFLHGIYLGPNRPLFFGGLTFNCMG